MEQPGVWQTDPDTLHVAEANDGAWKILREGAPTAESRHESKYSAIDAAKAIARERSAEQIKIHEPDGRLDEVIDLGV